MRTVARALGHLQVEAFAGFVFFAHIVIDGGQGRGAEKTAGCGAVGTREGGGRGPQGVSKNFLEARGAEVG